MDDGDDVSTDDVCVCLLSPVSPDAALIYKASVLLRQAEAVMETQVSSSSLPVLLFSFVFNGSHIRLLMEVCVGVFSWSETDLRSVNPQRTVVDDHCSTSS